MKKFLFVLLILFISLCSNAKEYKVKEIFSCPQDKKQSCDSSEKPITGIVREYYDNGNLFFESNFKNGRSEGVKKIYDFDGMLSIEQNYKKGKQEGIEKTYYNSGDLHRIVKYKNDKKEGIEKEYFQNGILKRETNYKKNEKDGFEKKYKHDGSIDAIMNYKNGKLIRQEYYDANKKLVYETYVNDKGTGAEKHYYSNGKLKSEVNLKNHKKNGIEKEYDTDGKLVNTVKYKNGEQLCKTDADCPTLQCGPTRGMYCHNNVCTLLICGGHGRKDGFWCICDKGYTGDDCRKKVNK